MGLADRLRRLRGEVGAVGPPGGDVPPTGTEPVPPGPGLAERIQRARTGRDCAAPAQLPDETVLAVALGAERLAPGVLMLERWLPARLRHGRSLLGGPAELEALPWTGAHGPADEAADTGVDPNAPAWLCFDTETSGLAGGTGTWAWLAGFLRPQVDGWVLRQYLLARLDAEPAYLDALAPELTAPARLVSYNGRAFDAPLLATRFRLAGRPDPLAGLPHLDLLAPVRRAFARSWPDCRLATAEERLLGVRRRDDLPGSLAPAAWLGWLRRGETAPLARVLRHNRDDLLSLACLLPALDRVYRDPAAHEADPRAVAAAHLSRGDLQRALAILAGSQRDLDHAGLLDLARLYRRTGDWARAVGIWEPLAAAGDAQAQTALARYHEHRSRDLNLALELTEGLPTGADRERRRGRLRAKLARTETNLCLGLTGGD